MPKNQTTSAASPRLAELDKFHEIEIQEVFRAVMSIQDSRIRSGTFFATVNLGALAIALETQKAGIFFLASLLILAFWVVDLIARRALYALSFRAIQLQGIYAPSEPGTFLSVMLFRFNESQVTQISQIQNQSERIKAIKALPARSPGLVGFWLPLAAFLLEIALGAAMWLLLKWTLF